MLTTMTPRTPKILFAGALSQDTLYQVDDFSNGPGKYIADNSIITASGMATTAATAAARLGGKASLWASVGEDAIGPALITEITDEGVDCAHVRCVRGARSVCATIVVDGFGERWVLVNYDPAILSAPTVEQVPPITDYAAVMADVRWPDAARIALKTALENGALAVLDADVADAEVLKDLAQYATHIVASADGARILGKTDTLQTAAAQIAQTYKCFVCVTDGANGAYWIEHANAGMQHIPCPNVRVVDTNGAGDVFHGAFTQALVEGSSSPHAIRFASAAAALKCQVLGGRLGAPTRDATLALVQDFYGSIANS